MGGDYELFVTDITSDICKVKKCRPWYSVHKMSLFIYISLLGAKLFKLSLTLVELMRACGLGLQLSWIKVQTLDSI